MTDIPAAEIADLLRRVASGTVPITVINYGFEVASTIEVRADGYRIEFFDDAGAIDYIEQATAPDGRHSAFDDWWKDVENDPFGLLSEAEQGAIDRIVHSAMAY